MPRISRFLLLCLLAITAAAANAQSPALTNCPWLTQGTAATALGGDVTVAVDVSETGEGACSFSRMQDPSALLKIEVSKSALAACDATATRLRGIGNAAMRCKLPGSADENAELISGRVRDLHFAIRIFPHRKQASANSSDKQDDDFEHVAELVAGNLF